MIIRDVRETDAPAWRELWFGYLAFYEQPLPDAVTLATWERLLDPYSAMIGRVIEGDTGTLDGFSHCVLHANTWAATPVCYLEDLFVRSGRRGGGVGRALIEDALALARSRSCGRLYWHTHRDNTTARSLYDRFAQADGFVRYTIAT